MKYYKDANENIFAFEDDGTQDYLIGDKIALTKKEVQEHLSPTKTAEQIEADKWKQFDDQWNNLKIGYSTIDKTTFQAKFGSELVGTYDANVLYNIDTLVAIASTDHVYKCSNEAMANLTQEKELLSSIDIDFWRESWGYFETNLVEISAVFLAIAPIKKQLIIDLFGVTQ